MNNYANTLIIPFTYIVTGVLTSGGTVQSNLTMAQDSTFELMAILASSTTDAETDTIPNNFSLLITDQSTGKQLSSARVPQRIMGGVAASGWGCIEKYPIRFPAGCVLNFDFLDLASTGHTVTVGLKGYKLFATR